MMLTFLSLLQRRRAQNRASQRAYRERKDQRIKDLEQIIKATNQENDFISQAYAALQSEFIRLKSTGPPPRNEFPREFVYATPPPPPPPPPPMAIVNTPLLHADLLVCAGVSHGGAPEYL